ncbi:hypothetical protein EDD18DRAFT_1368737 [Armillaria luteobubalina]|uniref:Uncharacterized protein n=1 Tax=Armillaria luteobubalina TaxID=153913 RepID=A0AA39UCH3_9AGAR|nr:hypothetical protein EDD18DRAFT_1368737 [Armillaria luteobubalina]
MLWALRSTRSGHIFNPNPMPLSTTFTGLVSLVFVEIDSSSLFCDTVELENEHSAEDDLDELDDIHVMPECHPTASLAPTSSCSMKHPLGAKEAGDGAASGTEAASTLQRHKKRCLAREQKYEAEGHRLSDRTLSLIQEKAVPIYTSLVTEALLLAKGAYSAKNVKESGAEHEYSCEELLALSFTEVPWEGFDPQPIVDHQGHIVAVMAGQPHDPSYSTACMEAHDAILHEGAAANFCKPSNNHHHGSFPAVNVRISYGKGQKVPSHLQNSALAAIINHLVGSEVVM